MSSVDDNPIRRRRVELGLTQSASAQRAMVCEAAWRNWEAGRALPRRRLLSDIAAALDWSIPDVQSAIATMEIQNMRRHGGKGAA